MCIRDSTNDDQFRDLESVKTALYAKYDGDAFKRVVYTCLLYTSDAADERSSVDLGGRRIIKKKKTTLNDRGQNTITTKLINAIHTIA